MTSDHYLPAEMAIVDVDEVTQGYYEACKRHQLTVQRCTTCGHTQHPPRAMCSACHSFDLEWSPVNGRGTVFTYTIIHHPIGPVSDRVPFNVVSVEIEGGDGVRMTSNVVDVPFDEMQIGMNVEVHWDDISDDLTLPRFRRVGGDS
jgi:uncharacterized OB-fold protein